MKTFKRIIYFYRLLWSTQDRVGKVRWLFMNGLTVLTVIFEFIGLGIIIPYFKVLSEPSLLTTNKYLAPLLAQLGFSTKTALIVFGACAVIFVGISSIVGFLGNLLTAKHSAEIATNISGNLFRNILNESYSYHLRNSSSHLISKISHVNSIGNGFINPVSQVFSRTIILMFILVTLFIVDPLVTVIGGLILMTVYLGIYKLVSKRVKTLTSTYLSSTTHRQRVMHESFHGIKEILVSQTQKLYSKEFQKYSADIWDSLTLKTQLSQFPKYLLEGLAFSTLLGYAMIQTAMDKSISESLTVIGLFAVLGFKMLPSFQSIYANFIMIVSTLPSLEILGDEICPRLEGHQVEREEMPEPVEAMSFKNVRFGYVPGQEVLKGISFIIKAGEKIAIVGSSGSGKSTMVDIILGLLSPGAGSFEVNATPLSPKMVSSWQEKISYVPQQIFISESSLAENVYFGAETKDEARCIQALKLAELGLLLENSLDAGAVFENGKNLSGGQRQRLGLARAIYRDAEILVLDEATSALDPETESKVWNNIASLPKTVILVTHRMELAKRADKVLYLDQGTIAAFDSFQSIYQNQPKFRKFVATDELSADSQ